MTLQCECGGAVEILDGSDPDDGPTYWERYRCVSCDRTGSYTFGPDGETKTGCLTTVDDYGRF